MTQITSMSTRAEHCGGVSEYMTHYSEDLDLATTMACDLTTRTCGVEHAETSRVSVTYVTDPICSACWAMEPAWRAAEFHYGHLLDVRHVYGGLLPKWDGFADPGAGIHGFGDVQNHWEEMAHRTGQSLNASVWASDPIASSFPPSLVASAVRDLSPDLESRFLRLLREELFVHGRNIARDDVWRNPVQAVGLAVGDVQQRLADGRAEQIFVADLEYASSRRNRAGPPEPDRRQRHD